MPKTMKVAEFFLALVALLLSFVNLAIRVPMMKSATSFMVVVAPFSSCTLRLIACMLS